MNAATVLRLPWFSILVVRPHKTRRHTTRETPRPRVRIAGLR